MANPARTPQPESGFEVTIVTPAGDTVRAVEGDVLTVGRAEGSHLVIAHETLSRRHLTVSRRGEHLFVEDHGSSNGSFVNGKRIRKNTPIALAPEDTITMGEATVRLRVALPKPAPVRVVPDEGDYEPTMTEVHEPTATAATGSKPIGPKTAAEPIVAILSDDGRLATERALAEAQRQATLIITQAEVEAEKRAEAILRRAHQAEAQMNEQYQKRMNEAYRGSEQLSQDAQRDARELIETARTQANEIRTQAEVFADDLRARTKIECERALEEAHRTARELRDRKMDEIVETERARREEAHAKLKHELDGIETRARKQITDEESRRRAEMDAALALAGTEHEELRAEVEALTQMVSAERAELSLIRVDLGLDRAEVKDLEARRATAQVDVTAAEADVARLTAARTEHETKIREAQTSLVSLNEDLARTTARVTQAGADVDQQLAELKTKLEQERTRAIEGEAQQIEHLKLETTRRARALELQMMEDLSAKREGMAREMFLNIDAFLKKGDLSTGGLEAEVRAVLDRQIAAIAEDDSIKRAQSSLVSLRRRQKYLTGLIGCMLGAMATFVGLNLQSLMSGDLSPMQRRLAAAQEARARDLEERKFNPDQSAGYKATYFDNVIYGLNFVDTYTSDDFQTKLRNEMTPYMLRVWRLDENKVIEALAISNAMVKSLGEKRKLINPDTLQKNLDGMKKDEAETLKRLSDTLGSQVRLESYLKFEKSFYDRYAKAP